MTSSGVHEQAGIREAADVTFGPWFVVHNFVCYFPSLLALILIIGQLIRLPAGRKTPAALILVGLILILVSGINQVFHIFALTLDLSPYIAQITVVLFYNALFNTRSFDPIFAAKNDFFDNSDNLLFVTDSKGFIVDHNRMAKKMAEEQDIDLHSGIKPMDFVNKWIEDAGGDFFKEEPTIFSVHEGETDAQYQIHEHDITGADGEQEGSYYAIENIKPIMSLVHMLQDAAYYDSMTGLPNRNHFNKKITETDFLERFPLCIMVGDVNRLKYVNDTFGHVKGDDLLITIARILAKCAPVGAFIARTGGDEFVGLMPNVEADKADKFILEVNKLCEEAENPEYGKVSIALGYKLRTSKDEDVAELMKAADKEMYSHKMDRRAQ
jgi:diguanylate cyclase (GGDEF)-like protein